MSFHLFENTLVIYLFVTLGVWIKRIFWASSYRRTQPPIPIITELPANTPRVSVIVPAKDEEKNILKCLTYLSKQNYPNYEIIVVDDRSVDKTPEILENFKRDSKIPFKIIRIEKLPPGWTGKNHAVFAGSRIASGEWLLFTDADTTHSQESLLSSLTCAINNKIDFLTLAPETEVKSFWEKTVQPLAVGSLALWFDSQKVNDPSSGVILANGQFILVKKDVYEKVGGNESVKSEVIEDVELARIIRAAGFKMNFLNGTRLYSTRMYQSLREIKTGWTRIFTHLFNKDIPAILHKIFLFLFFSILPFIILGMEKVWYLQTSTYFHPGLFILSAFVCGWIVLVRFIGNKLLKSPPWYAFLHPLGSLVMVWILTICIHRILFNRPSAWRGDLHA